MFESSAMDMRVSDIMVKAPVTVAPSTSVREIADLMSKNSIGSIILVEDDKPVGVVTERDLVRRVLAFGKDANSIMAADVCSKPVISIMELDDVEVAVSLMKKHRIRRLVVINFNEEVVGVLTTDDIGYNIKRFSDELAIDYFVASQRGKVF
jgi:CBS domain-containing protein